MAEYNQKNWTFRLSVSNAEELMNELKSKLNIKEEDKIEVEYYDEDFKEYCVLHDLNLITGEMLKLRITQCNASLPDTEAMTLAGLARQLNNLLDREKAKILCNGIDENRYSNSQHGGYETHDLILSLYKKNRIKLNQIYEILKELEEKESLNLIETSPVRYLFVSESQIKEKVEEKKIEPDIDQSSISQQKKEEKSIKAESPQQRPST